MPCGVRVPLGARGETTGVVWAENATPDPRLHNRMKDVVGKLELPPLRTELRQFIDYARTEGDQGLPSVPYVRVAARAVRP